MCIVTKLDRIRNERIMGKEVQVVLACEDRRTM